MPHKQHITRPALLSAPPNRLLLKPAPDVFDQRIQPLRYLLRTLAAGAPVAPDVPRPFAPLGALLADLLGGEALVVAVVPLADRLGDLDLRVGAHVCVAVLALVVPGELVAAAEAEELEGALGTVSWGDVAVVGMLAPENAIES